MVGCTRLRERRAPLFLIWAELDLLYDGGLNDIFKGAIGLGYHESVRGWVV